MASEIHPRPPKLRDPFEPVIVPDLDALKKELDDWNSRHPVNRPPVTLESLPVLPQVSSDELNRQIEEQLKLVDELMSRSEQGDDDGNSKENIGS
jgi:hypothetical protein